MEKNKILKIVIIIVLIITILDQVSKILITSLVPNGIGNENFAIEITENTGMAFGFNSGNAKNIVLSAFVLFILISFIRNQRNELDTKTTVAISMVIGGGFSNMIDRIFRGGVLDFIKILFIPNFNLADVAICTGWLLIVIFLIVYSRKEDVIKGFNDKIDDQKKSDEKEGTTENNNKINSDKENNSEKADGKKNKTKDNKKQNK